MQNNLTSPTSLKLGLFLAIGMISFGFAPIIVKLKPDFASPISLAAYRTIIAALLLLPLWLWKERTSIKNLTKQQIKLMAIAGLFLGIHFVLWISSLSYTSVASASVLVTIHPVIIILVERFLFKRNYPISTWIGVFTAFIGVAWLSWLDASVASNFRNAALGNLLAFLAAVVFVVYFFLGERVRKNHDFTWLGYVFPVYFFAAITCTFVFLIEMPEQTIIADPSFLWVALALAIGPQILGHGSLNYAVKYIQPTLLSSLILVEPAISSLMAVWVFGEIPTASQIFAITIIMVGISLTWLRKLFRQRISV